MYQFCDAISFEPFCEKMSIYLAILNKSFQITCIWLVLFMVYQQFKLYIHNEDSSSLSYRAFNQEEKDLYPTFSICLHSIEGGIFKAKYAKNGYESIMTLGKYHEILLGYEYINKELNAHLKTEFDNVEFDEMALNMLEDFVDLAFSALLNGMNMEFANKWVKNLNTTEQSPFYKSYQDPYFRCVSKSVYFTKKKLIDDIVVLNANDLYKHMTFMKSYLNITTYVLVYVHHRYQLVRELGKKILSLNEHDFREAINGSNNVRDMHISQVEVLRKRKDGRSKERCDPNLEDDDKMWREKVMEAVNCIPTYWKGLYSNPNMVPPNLPDCHSSIQYDYIQHNFLPPTIHLENGTNLYKDRGPCNQMKVLSIISSHSRNLTDEKTLTVRLLYDAEEYREIINREAFGI